MTAPPGGGPLAGDVAARSGGGHSLEAAATGDGERERVAARLRTLLAAVQGAEADEAESTRARIELASAADLFELIDSELG